MPLSLAAEATTLAPRAMPILPVNRFNEPNGKCSRIAFMEADMTRTATTIRSTSLQEGRKLALIAAIAGSHTLAVDELKMLLKLKQPERIGRR